MCLFIALRSQKSRYNTTRRSRSAFPTTDRELRRMAALALIGLIKTPSKEERTSDATGMLSTL